MGRWVIRLVKVAVLLAAVDALLRLARSWADRPAPEPAVEPPWPVGKLDDPEDAALGGLDTPDADVAFVVHDRAAAWVGADDAGGCPDGYPVKVKERSGIYHLPGMAAYDRTGPDRCYTTAEAAEADGFRAAKH